MSGEDAKNTKREISDNEEGATGGMNIPSSNRQRDNDFDKSPQQRQSLIPGVTDASPPRFVTWEEINIAATGITNMALAHEIAVDDDFRLEKIEPSKDSIHSRVKETIHNAFWDLLREQLMEDPPDHSQALVLLEDIKQNLFACLLAQHSRLKEEIEEVLDTELIKQQVNSNTLDFQYYANFVISMMAKLCAPVRDENVRELAKETDTVNVFRKILEVLDLMKLDMANFTISMFRTDIIVKSVEYEKSKFKQFLELQKVNGTDGLQFTREWLLRHYTSGCPSSKWYMILGKCFISLLEWNDSYDYPETVLMDRVRFTELGEDCHRLAIAGAVVLMSVSTSGGVLQNDVATKDLIKNHAVILLKDTKPLSKLKDILPNVAEQAVKDTNDAISSKGLGHFEGEKQNLLYHNIVESANPDHRIRYLIYQRLTEFLLTVITTDSSKKSSIQVPPGLSSLKQEIALISGRLLRLVQHNRDVFGEFYCDIFKEASSKSNRSEENAKSD
ncbi:T-complex protein 11-like protein 1 [Lycorma delicatula]|uniref:T-complex protein 11-like protein 1 n=1 Tax=Lycorma delicatula TaxID=130591 RepID=UPI003F513822